jgi:tRNA(His) guanylyltransferase
MLKDIFKGIFDKAYQKLGERMKAYEGVERKSLESKTPVIIRLDGRSFSVYTKGFEKPFDEVIIGAMKHTTRKLCEEIQNVKISYSQSDEITLFMSDYDNKNTQQWFGGNIQKMVSLASSIATYYFNDYMERTYWVNNPDKRRPANFDARAFNVPKHEVVNVMIWRQQDAIKNSISMLAQANFSHRELHRKSTAQMLEMLAEKDVHWDDLETYKKRGFCCTKEFYVLDPSEINVPDHVIAPEQVTRSRWAVDDNIPVFSEDKPYVELLVKISEIEDKFD